MGEVPRQAPRPVPRPHAAQRHAPLLVEEVLGFEGFSGNESILYHLHSPCRVKEVGEFTPIELEEWVPDTHVHRLTNTRGLQPRATVLGRRVLQYNGDVEIGICMPDRGEDYFYRNGEGDEVIFVHEGEGVVETIFGDAPYRQHDYVVIPRGTTYRFRFDTEQRWLTFYTPGEIETPNRYRNRYGQLLEHAPFSQRDFHPPAELRRTASAASSTSRSACAAATRTTCSTTTRSTSSAGTATSTRTRSTSPTSSPRPGGCTSRRPRTRRSRARTS